METTVWKKDDRKMIFTWCFWTLHDIPGHSGRWLFYAVIYFAEDKNFLHVFLVEVKPFTLGKVSKKEIFIFFYRSILVLWKCQIHKTNLGQFSMLSFIVNCFFLMVFAIYRSSPPYVFLRKFVLKIFSKFTGEHPCRSVISIKL